MSAPTPDIPPSTAAWLGQRIGNYRLVRLLGEGGMGMVFDAQNDSVGGRVAIKILRADVASRPDVVTRFFNEARAANAIDHPGIVRIFDSGFTQSGAAYLAMEFLSGEPLRARVARGAPLLLDDILRIGRQVASALHAAHRVGIIHRDLKPDNLMLVPDPELQGGMRIKILDFGIAKIAESSGVSVARTRTNILMGTPKYMSPENIISA